MARRNRKISGILLFFLFFTLFSFPHNKASGDEVKGLETLAISLIIDQSGSMNDTDPGKMRETSANILVDLLSPEDYLGIISFSTETTELQPMANVGETTKTSIKGRILGNLEAAGDTDYVKAFERAFAQLQTIEDKNVKKVIIFLTDGDPDPDPARRDEPGFMEGYMATYWNKVKEIGLAGYPVYTVGIGALNMEVMDRIATETQGAFAVYTNPSDVAVAFFDIISTLKNRNPFMNLKEEVAGEKLLDFQMDEYVSQETFVIRHTDGELGVEFLPPEGVVPADVLKMEKLENYTLVTINQKEKESTGAWQMKLSGTASVEVLGTRDLFVKIWMDHPVTNTLHPIGEPIEIRASLTGTADENLEIEGTVMVNGVQALRPITFMKDGEDFVGSFEDTADKGSYEIILNVKSGESIIAVTTSVVHVKVLPVLTSDLTLADIGYLQGDSRIIMSTLSLGSTLLKASSDLTLDYYDLVKRNELGEEVAIPLLDDGNLETGDAKVDDGRFGAVLSFDDLGEVELLLKARGTYKGEIFILERNLGKTQVFLPGTIEVSPKEISYQILEGEGADIVLRLKSTSMFQEVVSVETEEKFGVLSVNTIILEPNEEKEVTINLVPSIEADGESHNIPLKLRVDNEKTTVQNAELNIEVTVQTKLARLGGYFRENGTMILSLLLGALLIFALIYGVGMLLYQKNFRKLYFVTGKIWFYKNKDEYALPGSNEVDLYSFKKPKVKITFDEKKKSTSDFFIPGSGYTYDLIFEKQMDKSRYKFIDGYKSMKTKVQPKVLIRTTESGILLVDEEIYIKIEVANELEFTSGDYHFRYQTQWEGKNLEEGKNILDGKM